MEKIDINYLKLNENNPRYITKESFEKLKKSIKDFEKMLDIRPLLVDMKTGIVYGGNMRLRALQELGYKEIPKKWIKDISHLSDEEKRELIIKDNLNYGKWDFDLLATEYEQEELEEWGLPVIYDEPKDEEEETDELKVEKPEVEFSVEIDRKNNYVVLFFERDIDFIHIQSVLGLKPVASRRLNGKPWSIGIGRVVNGVEAIKKLKKLEL